jgi:hypothetical protein
MQLNTFKTDCRSLLLSTSCVSQRLRNLTNYNESDCFKALKFDSLYLFTVTVTTAHMTRVTCRPRCIHVFRTEIEIRAKRQGIHLTIIIIM